MTSSFQFKIPENFCNDLLKKDHEDFFIELLKFCMSDLTTENCIFIAAVDSYQKRPSADLCHYINNNFTIQGSANEVNISSAQRKATTSAPAKFLHSQDKEYFQYAAKMRASTLNLQKTSSPMVDNFSNHLPRSRSNAFSESFSAFDSAQLEIKKLIERDTLTRFLRDDLFFKKSSSFNFFRSTPTEKIYHSTNQRTCSESEFKKIDDFRKDMLSMKALIHTAFYIKREEFKNITAEIADTSW